jgi:hypothetical protein
MNTVGIALRSVFMYFFIVLLLQLDCLKPNKIKQVPKKHENKNNVCVIVGLLLPRAYWHCKKAVRLIVFSALLYPFQYQALIGG